MTSAFYEPDFKRLASRMGATSKPGDLVLSLGAGNIHEAGARLADDLIVLETLEAMLGVEGRCAVVRAAFQAHDVARGRPRPILGGADHRGGVRAKLSCSPANRTWRSLSWDAAPICSFATVASTGLVIHPIGGDFAKTGGECARDAKSLPAWVSGLKRVSGAAARQASAVSSGWREFLARSVAACG